MLGTGTKSGSCGNDIIHEKHVAACVGESPHQFKGVVNIVGALPSVFMGLRFGIYDAANKLPFHFQTCDLGDALRQHFALIITSLPHPLSCKRHRNNEIDALKETCWQQFFAHQQSQVYA